MDDRNRLRLVDPGPWKEPEKYLLSLFSGLRRGAFRVIGPVDPNYNCIGYADGSEEMGCVSESVHAYVAHFEQRSFVKCDEPDCDPLDPLIAIFARDDRACHVALRVGERWTSKIGGGVTIEHDLADLCGERATEYGRVVRFMKKKCAP